MNILIETHKFNFVLPMFLWYILEKMCQQGWLLLLNDTQLFKMSGKLLKIRKVSKFSCKLKG